MRNLRNALRAARKTAARELSMLVFVIIFGLIVSVIALPIIWLMMILPDWTWWIWSAIFIVWLLFGETINAAIQAYRGDQE